MSWTLEEITIKLEEIKNKGFIPIPPERWDRRDEGVVGQVLEGEFGVIENNLSVSDLGVFELKGMRSNSNTLTLCHKTTTRGLSPLEVFDRFGYVKPSNRDNTIMKKKLFTTVTGKRENNLGFRLRSSGSSSIDMYFGGDFICGWELDESIKKISQIILVIAKATGGTASRGEKFHYVTAHLLRGLKSIDRLVTRGTIVIDFCIDQAVGSTRQPHDRGPHIRIPKTRLSDAYDEVKTILY